ncbi:MAG: hypothetical protein AAB069_08780 [Planctomycetota bacterium]
MMKNMASHCPRWRVGNDITAEDAEYAEKSTIVGAGFPRPPLPNKRNNTAKEAKKKEWLYGGYGDKRQSP